MSFRKTLPILTILTCALTFSGQAQRTKTLWLDVRTGLNSNFIVNQNAYGNGEQAYTTTLGLTTGLGATYFLSYNWGANVSVNWTKLGQKYSGLQSSGEAIRKIKLNYVEIPLLAMHRIGRPTKLTWIAFGPDILILANAKQEYERVNGSPLPFPENMVEGTTIIKDRFKPVDVALYVSLNKIYDIFQNRDFRLMISANMALGLTDINSKIWQTPNMHGKYAGSHNLSMGIKAALMYKSYVRKN